VIVIFKLQPPTRNTAPPYSYVSCKLFRQGNDSCKIIKVLVFPISSLSDSRSLSFRFAVRSCKTAMHVLVAEGKREKEDSTGFM